MNPLSIIIGIFAALFTEKVLAKSVPTKQNVIAAPKPAPDETQQNDIKTDDSGTSVILGGGIDPLDNPEAE